MPSIARPILPYLTLRWGILCRGVRTVVVKGAKARQKNQMNLKEINKNQAIHSNT